MKKTHSISVFFPAYNEEKNIKASIEKALETLVQITDTYEVIVVNDGSHDNTALVVQEFAKKNSHVKLVQHERNKGYGEGLKSGISSAKYDYIFFTDSDLQFDLNELKTFVEYIPEYDVVIGYREIRNDPKIRLLNANLWNIANRILFGLKVRDIDCAFKLLKRDQMQKIRLTSGGAMTSAEILLKLNEMGVKMKELPVTHFSRKAGTQTGAKPSVILRAGKEMWHLYSVEMGEKTQIQFVKFAIIGVLNTVTTLFIYTLLTRFVPFFSRELIGAEVLAYVAGMVVSFKFNRRWTFREYWKTNYQEVLRFLTTSITALVGNILIFYFLVEIIKFYDIISVLLCAIFTFAWNFILSKYWVFKKNTVERI
jgi:glycosyltransferase involved in cell wall biosynthesis